MACFSRDECTISHNAITPIAANHAEIVFSRKFVKIKIFELYRYESCIRLCAEKPHILISVIVEEGGK